ncbi:hypothetical protein C5S32_07980 [ANME-1 cluster archaeon GoMg1]|nr:hypothetical protein [ANME-1 cluster archaeon GoMg1]
MVIRMRASLAEEEISIVKESHRRELTLSEAKVNLKESKEKRITEVLKEIEMLVLKI